MTNNDKWWGVIVVILLIAIIGFGAYSLVTGRDLAAIEIVLTALLLKFGTMIDFRYGSSRGSKEKTDAMTELLTTPPAALLATPVAPVAPAPAALPPAPVAQADEAAKEEQPLGEARDDKDAEPLKVGDIVTGTRHDYRMTVHSIDGANVVCDYFDSANIAHREDYTIDQLTKETEAGV